MLARSVDSVLSPALVKGVYLDTVVRVLLQDLLRVFICVEGVHEDQGHVCVVSLVQVLWDVKKTNTHYCQTASVHLNSSF